MKKLFVFAIFLAVIGILCAVFFMRPNKTVESDEKPWTVGDVEITETTRESTTQASPTDTVSAFSKYIDANMRNDRLLLDENESYTQVDLFNAVYGLYMYDVDTDGAEELAVVRGALDGIYLDMYEFEGGAVKQAASMQLVLDSTNNVVFAPALSVFSHIAARMTIYPLERDRYICLTVEQQDVAGEYNAYSIVIEYAKSSLRVKKSFRLRRDDADVTLMRLDKPALLYQSSFGEPTTDEAQETVRATAKYSDLDTAFKTEFADVGLSAPQTKIENGMLAQYKVTAVPSEQHVFEFSMENNALRIIENGFLQSFLIRH